MNQDTHTGMAFRRANKTPPNLKLPTLPDELERGPAIVRMVVSKWWRRFIGTGPLILFAIAVFAVAILLWTQYQSFAGKKNDLFVEGFGFLLDIAFFGLVLTLYQKWTARARELIDLQNQLSDFCRWRGEEAVFRKAGIIRRLTLMKVGIPWWDLYLDGIYLKGADLKGLNLRKAMLFGGMLDGAILRGANAEGLFLNAARLEFADAGDANLFRANMDYAHCKKINLAGANLEWAALASADLRESLLLNARLEGADLRGANLSGANLLKVRGLTWSQLEGVSHDNGTFLPAYLKPEAPPEYVGRFDDDVECVRAMQEFVKESDRRDSTY